MNTLKQAAAEERAHHPYSPSTLQNREACPCYQTRSGVTNIAARDGTRQHAVVETGEDDQRLDDDKALAAAECIELYEAELAKMQEERNVEEDRRIRAAHAAGQPMYIPTPNVTVLTEVYLPVDDLKIEDLAKNPDSDFIYPYLVESTTAGYVDRGVLNWNVTKAVLLDWKFGRWPVERAEKNLQGIAYALGLFRKYPTLEEVKFIFKMPHLAWTTDFTFTRAMIPELYLRVQTVVHRSIAANQKVILKNDFSDARPFVPVCNFCNRIGQCPKVFAIACEVAEKYHPVELPSDIFPTGAKSDEDIQLGMRLAQVLKTWAEGYRSQIQNRAISSAINGEIKVPEGFTIVQVTPRVLADAAKFREVTTKFIEPAELEAMAKYTLGDIEEKINEKAPRGQKKATIERYGEELLASGAMVKGDSYSFLKAVPTVRKQK